MKSVVLRWVEMSEMLEREVRMNERVKTDSSAQVSCITSGRRTEASSFSLSLSLQNRKTQNDNEKKNEKKQKVSTKKNDQRSNSSEQPDQNENDVKKYVPTNTEKTKNDVKNEEGKQEDVEHRAQITKYRYQNERDDANTVEIPRRTSNVEGYLGGTKATPVPTKCLQSQLTTPTPRSTTPVINSIPISHRSAQCAV